jgi:hypothetical protein
MGEEKTSALSAPAKEVVSQSTAVAEAEAPVIPGIKSSIPATIPKPKLPLPSLPISSSNNDSTMAKKDFSDITKRDWNTSKLGLRVGVDALSAGAAGALVAPVITMIDKGIIENASGRNTLGESLKKSAHELLLKPHRFISSKPFVLIFVRSNQSKITQALLLTSTPTVPLLWHLLHSQHHRHRILDPQSHLCVLHNRRHPQIPSHQHRQPRPLSLQRQQIYPTLRLHGPFARRPPPHLRALHNPRLHDNIRLVQSAPPARTILRRAYERGCQEVHVQCECGAICYACGCAVGEHAVAFARIGFV